MKAFGYDYASYEPLANPNQGQERYTFRFSNSYGASVIRPFNLKSWELAVLYEGDLVYTPITEGTVYGTLEGLTEADVTKFLKQIESL